MYLSRRDHGNRNDDLLYMCCIEYKVDLLNKFRMNVSENERLISVGAVPL